ncbi:transposase [Flavobacterium sp. LAR06]
MNHYQTILNYSDNRSTNALAESFNAKIKVFRS